jgi:hypothetical protein
MALLCKQAETIFTPLLAAVLCVKEISSFRPSSLSVLDCDVVPMTVLPHRAAIAAATTVAAAGLVMWLRKRRARRSIKEEPSEESVPLFISVVSSTPLPKAYAEWEDIAARLVELNLSGRLRAAVDAMTVIRVGDLPLPCLRRARVLLACLVASYAHGGNVPWDCLELTSMAYTRAPSDRYRYIAAQHPTATPDQPGLKAGGTEHGTEGLPVTLPQSIALPWREVSERLGMPPVIVATDLDLWNRASNGYLSFSPATALREYRQMFSMTGTASERGFHAVPFAMQLALGPLLPYLLTVPELVERGDTRGMQRVCERIADAIGEARIILRSIYDMVWADEFYDVYRVLLAGWAPLGLQLPALPGQSGAEPSSGGEYISRHGGPSAGQTAIIICIDLALGVEHGSRLVQFQQEMREYMPAQHKQVIEQLAVAMKRSGNLRTAAQAQGAPAGLAAAHASALQNVAGMRAYHLGIATHYLRRALKGTGGSDFRSMLDEGVRSTRRSAST